MEDLQVMSKETIKKKIKDYDTEEWKKEMENKESLRVYRVKRKVMGC